MAARASAAPSRARADRGSVPPSPTPAHVGGLGGSLAQSHCPQVVSFPGVSPAEGEEGVQPSRQGQGLRCQQHAGEWEV